MGKTLFRYIFRDLLKVFLLAAVAIAGILSFAGLLRPLTERGLGAAQAVRILIWLMPAMLAYSVPVAALFATTFVYGRLSADNEAVAIKAAGIPASPTGLLRPALGLALMLLAISFLLLCFVVPAANLQVEQTIWSNLARLAANNVNRTSRITFDTDTGSVTIFADEAVLPSREELDRARAQAIKAAGDESSIGVSPDVQVVQLRNAYVIRYTGPDHYQVPGEVFTARAATVYIDPPAYARGGATDRLFDFEEAMRQSALSLDQLTITVMLADGAKFPRQLGTDATPASVVGPQPVVAATQATQFGPIRRETPIRVNPKFMDVRELKTLLDRPELSRLIINIVRRYARADQRVGYLRRLESSAVEAGAILDEADGSRLTFTADAPGTLQNETLFFQNTPVRLVQRRPLDDGDGEEIIDIEADSVRIEAEPLTDEEGERPKVLLVFTFPDASVTIDGHTTAGRSIERRAVIPMPDDLAALTSLSAADYLEGRAVEVGGTELTSDQAGYLLGKLAKQNAGIVAELHGRAAFIAACALLPILGAGLGLMFRSGNFLTAFAVSTIPAAICVLMIVVGQHVTGREKRVGPEELANPTLLRPPPAGIAMIWSGDIAALVGGSVLIYRLRRS